MKWGIVGLGNIAHLFVQDLLLVENTSIEAVASRTLEKAEKFASQYGVEKAYGSYSEIFRDSEIDIVYIATPHNSHETLSIEAMNGGKHVLCEKPLAVNRKQAGKMVASAKKNQVFLMEAFWSRFNPSIEKVLDLVEKGAIGAVNYLNADFTFYRDDPDDSRMLSAELAGGSLLDMGVYPVFLAYCVFGKPEEILATARLHTTGADLQTSAILKYKNGIANLMSGFKSQSDMVAKIYGEGGQIFINSVWHETQGFRMVKNGVTENYPWPTKGKGFTYEIEECLKCIAAGKLESDKWSLQNSLDLTEITDEIRRQAGIVYPFET